MVHKAEIELFGEEPNSNDMINLKDYEKSQGTELDLVELYFKEISEFPVLSCEEEKECCRAKKCSTG